MSEADRALERQQARLEHYRAQSTQIAEEITRKHNAARHRRRGPTAPIDAAYWKLSAHMATDSHPSVLRLRLASFLLAGGPAPHGPSVDRIMLEFGSFSWSALAYAFPERHLALQLFDTEKRSKGRASAVFGWCKGLARVISFSLLSDWACLRCLRLLHAHKFLPGHLPLTVSLAAGNALVRSVAWRMRGRRSFPGIACGEGITLLLQAEPEALWVSMQPTRWRLPICLTVHIVAMITVHICEANQSETWTLQDVTTYLGLTRPTAHLVPACIMSPALEDAFDAAECHDMKCPITFAVMVQPVEFEGKLYERSAAEKWISRHARVPHSPETPAFLHSLRPCSDMDRLLRQFRAEFGLGIEWEAS